MALARMNGMSAPLLAPSSSSLIALWIRAARPQAPTPVTAAAAAIRSNNLGVASMNQQKFEAALKYFEEAAARRRARSRVARTNQAIALACSAAVRSGADAARSCGEGARATTRGPGTTWDCLQKSLGDAEAALAAFTRASELRPARRARALLRRPPGKSAPAVRHARSRSSSGRSSSIRSSSPRSSASRARSSARARPTTPRPTWIASRG